MKLPLSDAFRKLLKTGDNSRLLFSGQSLFGPVDVRKAGDRVELRTGEGHLQSATSLTGKITGSVWDYYLAAPAFLPGGHNLHTVCLLGLGVGTAAKLYNKIFSPRRIVGVEVDPVIIDLGRKYFSLNDENLEIVCADAGEFIATTGEKFDLIIVDTFKQDCFADNCDHSNFYDSCREHLNPGGVVVVNRATTKKQKEANLQFRKDIIKIFPQIYTLAVHWNTFYFGLSEPLGRDIVLGRLKTLGESKNLSFLRELNPDSLQSVSC
ncbi:MAG: methyltransferase domain-containing protein [Patescibacteria group bacterium]